MKKIISTLIYLSFAVLVFAGCGEPKKADMASVVTPPPPSAASDIPADTQIYVKLAAQWESDGATGSYEVLDTCSLPVGSNAITCNFKVPEVKLYHSNLRFIVGTKDLTNCPRLSFTPYYYTRSKSNTYMPPDSETAIDCSKAFSKNPAKCFGGAAPTLVPEFPKNTSNYFLTNLVSEINYDIKSSNQIRWYDTLNVNYLITNNLSAAGRATNVPMGPPNERVAGTFIDYSITCGTKWEGVISEIKLIISDENQPTPSPPGQIDDYTDWF